MAKSRSLKFWLSAIALPFVLLAIFERLDIVNFVRYRPPFTTVEFAQIIGALGTFILTGGLVYLYLRQTQILDEEQKQTEFQAKALIRVEDFRIIPPNEVKEYAETQDFEYWDHLAHADFVEVELSNFGRAPADDMRAEAMLHGDMLRWETQGQLVKGGWKTAVNKLTGNQMDPVRLNDQGAAIGTDERNVTYSTPLYAIRDNIKEQWGEDFQSIQGDETDIPQFLSASEILWLIQDYGEGPVDAGIRLWYRDGTGDRDPINLQFATAESPRVADFQTAVVRGRPMMPDEIPPPAKWWE